MSSEGECVLDTVVLLYFLLVDREPLLRDLVGDPLRVPRSVYDPEDRSLPASALRHPGLLGEMRQSIRHYDVAVRTGGAESQLLDRVRHVDALHGEGHLEVVDMADDELLLAARLQSRDVIQARGIRAPLGPGEAACVAISWLRKWTIATHDVAALTVLSELHEGRDYSYERIRKLLIRAADSKLISATQANKIHEEMRDLGFWDAGRPFP